MICGTDVWSYEALSKHYEEMRAKIGTMSGIEDWRKEWLFGCDILTLFHHSDDRGWLSVLTPEGFGEVPYAYYSCTWVGKARDEDMWHKHDSHTDRFVVLQGTAIFYVSNGIESRSIAFGGTPYRMLIVPPGVLHCFRAVDDVYDCKFAALLNMPDEAYDPADELRIQFSESIAGRPW